MEAVKKYLRIFLGIPATLISFVFIGKVFFDNRGTITEALLSVNPLILILGLLFMSAFFALKAYIWVLILEKRGFKRSPRKTIYEYSLSEIKRYIPGSIVAVFGRINSHADSVPKKETLKGIGIEALLLGSSALLVSLPAISFWFNHIIPGISLINLTLPLLLLIIGIGLLTGYAQKIFSYFNIYILYVLAWVLYSIGCLLTAVALTGFPFQEIFIVLSIFTFSWLAGYLVFITPMGLGVREAAATYLLSLFFAFPVASVIAVLTRISMIAGELIFLAVARVLFSLRPNSRFLKLDPAILIVAFFAANYFVIMTSLAFLKHDVFLTGRFDLGNMSQTVWNTAHGRFFTLTNPDGTEIVSRLAVHSDFILILFAPLYFLWSDPRMLLLIQSLILSFGGVFVYLIAKKIIHNKYLSAALSISFFTNFWLHEQNLFDFHAVSLATTFLLGAFYFLIQKKYFFVGLFLLLAGITKENVFLIIPFFGVYLYFVEKKKTLGILLLTVSVAIFFFLSSYAIPEARNEAHFAVSNYGYLGSSPQEIVLNIILKPQVVFQQVFSLSTLNYLHQHLLPLGYLPIFSPAILIAVIPEMAIYLLSSNLQYRSYEYHFGALIIPFFFIATVYSVNFLLRQNKVKVAPLFIFYYLLFFAFTSCYLYSPLPGMKRADYSPFLARNTEKIRTYLSLVPQQAKVAATNNIASHLSHRDYIFVLPFGLDRADYIVIYKEIRFVENVDTNKYDLIISESQDGFYLYKKKITIACKFCIP